MAPTSPDPILDDILDQVALGADDRARLDALCDRLEPQLPELAARFYAWIARHPALAALLHGEAQVARLQTALIDWMRTGLRGPYDDQFYVRRARIGRQHVVARLPQQSMFTAMNLLRGEFHDRIAALYPPDEARRVSRSVDKLLDVELALMLRHYQLDSEAKLVARERRAQADRVAAIQTLSAGLAHELRNPLNAAKLQLELLERRLRRDAADARLVEPIELAHHELERLTRLLHEFLAFARPSDLVLDEHDAAALVREVVAAEQPAAQARGATLEVVADGALRAQLDAGKLRQIVRNLVHNAVEAATASGRVTATVRGDDDQLYLTIEDDGPGIPEAVRHRIYEPFFTTKPAGTGLGLSIVHGMVSLHGGTIAIDSSPQGTRCDVVLPRRGAAASSPARG